MGRAQLEGRSIPDEDLAATAQYTAGDPALCELGDEEGLRSRLSVPLIGDDTVTGVIILSRREVALFDARDVALLDTFAEQAVIAIENVRQFKALAALNPELGDRVQAQVGEIERMGRLKRLRPESAGSARVAELRCEGITRGSGAASKRFASEFNLDVTRNRRFQRVE